MPIHTMTKRVKGGNKEVDQLKTWFQLSSIKLKPFTILYFEQFSFLFGVQKQVLEFTYNHKRKDKSHKCNYWITNKLIYNHICVEKF
jgi:hypothetical protein